MTRRCKFLVVSVVALPLLAYTGWFGYVRLSRPHVEKNALVGRTEAQVRRSYGYPDEDSQGYQSLALYVPPSLPPGSIRTLIFHPRRPQHPEGGTLWVWMVERDGAWICFESCWFANGVQF